MGKTWKLLLKIGLPVLVVALFLGGTIWMKEHYYSRAQKSEAIGRYGMAAQEYEQAGRYKDAEEKTAEMNQLAEITRTELLKLIQIPEFDETHTVHMHYSDLNRGTNIYSAPKLIVVYYPGNGLPDSEFQWMGLGDINSDNIQAVIVSYDPDTGEYLFVLLSAHGYNPLEGNSEGEIIAWGRLNEAGELMLEMKGGNQLLLEPVGYENYTTGEKRKIEN